MRIISIYRHHLRCLLTAAVLMTAAVTASAQPEHNDTLRTKTWSFYLQGGLSGFHGVRGENNQYDRDVTDMFPSVDFGVFYHPRPWLRFGLNLGYNYLKSADPDVLQKSVVTENVTRGEYTGTLTENMARIQNRNFTNVGYGDLNMGINFVEIWRERQNQWFNIWMTIGAGYMHGWNKYDVTWAVDETLISTGPEHKNLYEHSYIKSYPQNNQFNAFYVPLGLSIEFDVLPQLTLAAVGQYKYFPLNIAHTPVGIWTAGAAIRLNLVGRKQGFTNRKDRLNNLSNDVSEYEKELKRIMQNNEELSRSNQQLSEENSRLMFAQSEQPEVVVQTVPYQLEEVEAPLSDTGVQIMAFRVYQPRPDDKIFFGDNPTIYKNGDLRRYVVFTKNIAEAKAKLAELRKKYHDAFVVTIGDDGIVRPYRQ